MPRCGQCGIRNPPTSDDCRECGWPLPGDDGSRQGSSDAEKKRVPVTLVLRKWYWTKVNEFRSPDPASWHHHRVAAYWGSIALVVSGLALLGIHFVLGVPIRQHAYVARGELLILGGAIGTLGARTNIKLLQNIGAMSIAAVFVVGLIRLGIEPPSQYGGSYGELSIPASHMQLLFTLRAHSSLLVPVVLLLFLLPLLATAVGGWSQRLKNRS